MNHFLSRIKSALNSGRPGKSYGRKKSTPKIFIHVPKTAGTSFRTAAEARLGRSRILKDYGPESDDTSKAVRNYVYSGNGPEDMSRAISEHNALLVTGHFPLNKYRRLFSLADTATLLRNPVEQVISHYRHQVRHYGHEGTLMEFARRAEYRNVQSQYLANIDPALIGLVGTTESFKEFLSVLNEQWEWALPHRKRNVGKRLRIGRDVVSREEQDEIKCLNEIDGVLYRRASAVFANRWKGFELGLDSDVRGGITHARSGDGLQGWALDMRSNEAVTIELLVNGRPWAKIVCDQSSSLFEGWISRRDGQAGFAFDSTSLEPGSTLEIRDSLHGFLLDSRQLESPA